ncbi:MAG: contractile injection system tape measure protein [Methylobacter sp.]
MSGNKDMMHHINRLRFELSCPEEEPAFKLRQSFAQTFQPEIIEVIDKICSEYVAEDEWLQIDVMDIDLGRFSPHLLARDFAAVFREQFEKELVKKLNAFTFEQRKTSKEQTRMELFCHFLLHGTLPWWSSPAEADIDAIVQELHTHQPEQLRAFFYRHKENRAVWARAAFQLNDQAKRAIISLFSELQNIEIQLPDWLELCKTYDIRFNESARILAAAHGVLLRSAPEVFNAQEFEAAISHILDAVINEAAADLKEDIIQWSKAAFNVQKQQGEEAFSAPSNAQEMDAILTKAAGHTHQHNIGISSYAETETDSQQRYLVHHSGVVLLAPFFRQFFDVCGLLDGIEWKNKNTQYQAVHLLKYLAADSRKTPEYSLVLEKLCCGIALEEPVPLDVGLQDDQLAEARALLSSVIEHWKALKNTSIDGLRETFLKRDGLITRKNDAWLLRVEQKTLDVLLDSIPWGYSTVALPWNDYLIHVEW